MNTKQDTTIVTGGGQGIGRAIARRMAEDSNVLVVGLDQEKLKSVCLDLHNLGLNADFVAGDVADENTAERVASHLKQNNWSVKNLICNAGIGKSGAVDSYGSEMWRRVFDVNVHGAFYFVKKFLPGMLERKSGNIILMSSTAGLRGFKYVAAYTASKHALVGFAKSLAQEYGKRGIVTVPFCPGYVDTEMTTRTIRGLMERQKISEEEARAKIAKINPQDRIIPPEEIAEMVAFVCSGKVPSLSGWPLSLSGGEV